MLSRAVSRSFVMLRQSRGASKFTAMRCLAGWMAAKKSRPFRSGTRVLDLKEVLLAIDTSRMEFIPYLEIWKDRCYDFPFLLGPLAYVVDVGANIGTFSLYHAKNPNTPKRVIAFEPAPSVFPRLVQNVKLNKLSNVETINAAVGDKEGNILFVETPLSINCHVAENGEKGVLIPRVCLDSALADVPVIDLLKIDAEGHELKVLLGAKETLRRTRNLVIEVSSEGVATQIREMLTGTDLRFITQKDGIVFYSRYGR